MKRLSLFSAILLLAYVSAVSDCLAQLPNSCCDDPTCAREAGSFAGVLNPILSRLGARTNDRDTDTTALNNFAKNNAADWSTVLRTLSKVNQWIGVTGDRNLCFQSLLTPVVRSWVGFIRSNPSLNNLSFRSAEFPKGSSLIVELSQGGLNAFGKPDMYAASGRLLYRYTFGTDNKPTGGWLRLLIGPSLFYYDKSAFLMGTLRPEIRLVDIANSVTSLGNARFILETNTNGNYWLYGGGVGLDVGPLGAEMIVLRRGENGQIVHQFGISYRLFPKKKK